jgi:ubiquinone/menaquinone biosynthesis C-methylase UbiE
MAFEDLKRRQSVMWGAGPYQPIGETLADIHQLVVERLQPQPGQRWLDLACGTGAVAERAARAGAIVTGVDLAPGLLEHARLRALSQELTICYQVDDCERLDGIADGSFDAISSTCGVMFSPDHHATADQLVRVLKPGGRLGMAAWTPDGGVGKLFEVMASFVSPPPPSNPFDWGKRNYVVALLGDDFDLQFEKRISTYRTTTGEAYWDLFSKNYGPTKTLADSLGPRREILRHTWIDFFETNYRHGAEIVHDREWLFVLGTKR